MSNKTLRKVDVLEDRDHDPDVEDFKSALRRKERLSRKSKERRSRKDFDDNWN